MPQPLRLLRFAILAPYFPIRVAWLWHRGTDLTAKRQYHAALEHVDKAERLYRGKLPPDFALLKAVLFCNFERFDEAEKMIADVQRRLSERPYWRKHKNSYVIAYCSYLTGRIHEATGRPNSHDPQTEYASFSLDKVPSWTKCDFPLRDHPEWRQDHSTAKVK